MEITKNSNNNYGDFIFVVKHLKTLASNLINGGNLLWINWSLLSPSKSLTKGIPLQWLILRDCFLAWFVVIISLLASQPPQITYLNHYKGFRHQLFGWRERLIRWKHQTVYWKKSSNFHDILLLNNYTLHIVTLGIWTNSLLSNVSLHLLYNPIFICGIVETFWWHFSWYALHLGLLKY